jgi:hypothetical protein
VVAVFAALILAGCSDSAPPTSTVTPGADTPSATNSTPPSATNSIPPSKIGPGPTAAARCGSPTDHVYHPYRLKLIAACRTVTGTIAAIRAEADGDYHVLLALDPQYSSMLQPANTSGEHGDLVLEPICQHSITQADAVGPCQGPVALVPIPPIGTHVSATGSYVYDLDHGGWAELHPLFEIHPG